MRKENTLRMKGSLDTGCIGYVFSVSPQFRCARRLPDADDIARSDIMVILLPSPLGTRCGKPMPPEITTLGTKLK